MCSYNTENEDYIPIMDSLSFTVMTGNTQCINISVIDDGIVERDETFTIEVVSTPIIAIVSSVKVEILNDDCKSDILRYAISMTVMHNVFRCFLSVVVVSFDRQMITVNESDGIAEVCVVCSELPQREILVNLEQQFGTATGSYIDIAPVIRQAMTVSLFMCTQLMILSSAMTRL